MASGYAADHAAESFQGLLLGHRGRTSLTQRELAARMGTSARTVENWEGGVNYPSAKPLRALIAALLESGGLTIGREAAEAEALWAAALRSASRMHTPFDQTWFADLLVRRAASRGSDATQDRATMPTLEAAAPSEMPERREDWGDAPDVFGFLGRIQELATLQRWVVEEHCRLVVILGLGGIGKTTLAAQLAAQVAPSFERVFWRSVRNAPSVSEWLGSAIAFLSDQKLTLPEREPARLALLLQLLRERSCLLALDNFETLLMAGEYVGQYREGYAGYATVLHALSEGRHQSCLLLTSRESPPELGALGSPPVERTLELGGLDVPEGRALLADKHLTGDERAWGSLVARYGGNGLALRLVGESIRQVFAGDLHAFLEQAGSGAVFGSIRRLLDEQVQRSSGLERQLLTRLAIEREPVTLAELLADLGSHIGRGATLEVIEALRNRSLVELAPPGAAFTLQSVVLEYLTDRMVELVTDEIARGQPAELVQHPLVKGIAKDYVRHSQERFIGQPIVQQLIAEFGADGAERRLVQLLEGWRGRHPAEHLYGPGNVANLLRLLRGDLRGVDLSGLSIRQAFLQGVDAQDVCLARARISETVLGDAFDAVGAVAVSADGTRVAAGTLGGQLLVWQVADRAPLVAVHGHIGGIWSTALSADGRLLACGGDQGRVGLWDTEDSRPLAVLEGHTAPVNAVAFSADGRTIASGSLDGTVRLWDTQHTRPLAVLEGHTGRVNAVAFTADGRTIASSSRDGTVRLWQTQGGRALGTLEEHTGTVGVAFSPDGGLLASGGSDGTVRVLDTRGGQVLAVFEGHVGPVFRVAFGADGRTIASGGLDGTVRLWDTERVQSQAILEGHAGGIMGVAFSADGRLLVSGSLDATVRLWSFDRLNMGGSGQCLAVLGGHTQGVHGVALSPDGQLLASGGVDGSVRLWETESGRSLAVLKGHIGMVPGMEFSADGLLLASAGNDATVRLWDAACGRPVAVLEGHTGPVLRVAFGAGGRLVASGGLDGTVRLWQAPGGRPAAVLEGHTGGVMGVAVSSDGQMIASGGHDGTVRLWQTQGGRALGTLEGHASNVVGVAFSADGHTLASGSLEGTVRLWQVESGRPLAVLEGHSAGVYSIALSADGRLVARGGSDGAVQLLDAQVGQVLSSMRGHTAGVWGVAFSADGGLLASGSDDGTVKLWDISTSSLLRTLRPDRRYERADITGLTGVTEAQRTVLLALGAVERSR